MYCNRCGALVKDNAAFCAQCGNRLNYQNLAPNNPHVPPHYTPPNNPKKNHTAAIILSIVGFLILAAILFFVLRSLGENSYSASRSATPSLASPSASQVATGASDESAEASAGNEEEAAISDSDLMDYFCQVALNVEYGSANGVLKRWEKPIRVKVMGDYTDEDYATLTDHIDTLNGLGILPKISIVSSDANFFIYFVPLDEMDDVIPGYVEGNWGYFYLYWGSSNYVINKAYMGIATDVTTQEARNHLILEEFTQSLGLMNDSYDYENSIFQAEWTTTQSLMDIDYMLLYMLYNDYLEPGMGEYEVRDILGKRLEDILSEAA